MDDKLPLKRLGSKSCDTYETGISCFALWSAVNLFYALLPCSKSVISKILHVVKLVVHEWAVGLLRWKFLNNYKRNLLFTSHLFSWFIADEIHCVFKCVALNDEGWSRGSSCTDRVWSPSGSDKASAWRHQQHSRMSLSISLISY